MALTLTPQSWNIRNDCVPFKKVKIYEKDQPWFDIETRKKLTKKNRAFKVYSKAIDQVKRMENQQKESVICKPHAMKKMAPTGLCKM